MGTIRRFIFTLRRVYGGQEINPFSTMTCFHIHSAFYLVILYNFRNFMWGLE
ncbi:hypothetical protein E2C01_081296 [Portunus trituberculatus]|uniref:Uncharacterized protein n=1 Tax=Portunus trituberculatus TaxID=210409 RepID=A0A5B7IYF0_PORTR|nr:hypothetical protein [Portunus trituberculatus]